MHGHLETAGTAATSIAFGANTADETSNSTTPTAGTPLSNETLELAFDMVGAAIGAFLDSLS